MKIHFHWRELLNRISSQADLKFMSENVLHLGLCLPTSCTNQHIEQLVQRLFENEKYQKTFGTKTKVIAVKDLVLSPRLLLHKSFLILVICFALSKTVRRAASKQEKRIKLDDNNNAVSCTEQAKALSPSEQFIKCFDYAQNKKSIRDRESLRPAYCSISGLR
jgi:hypothetical protein